MKFILTITTVFIVLMSVVQSEELERIVLDQKQFDILDIGADSSGGGSFIKNEDNQLILLDYYQIDHEFKDTFKFLKNSFISLKPSALVLGYQKEKIDFFSKMKIYKTLMGQLDLWQQNSPQLVYAIKESLKAIEFRITPLDVISFYKNKNIIGAVFYTKNDGVWLSARSWNNAGDLSKSGLLLHEAFRHMDIACESKMREEDIIYLTHKIMLTSPQEEETLDKKDYFQKNSHIYNLINADNRIQQNNISLKQVLEVLLQNEISNKFPSIRMKMKSLYKKPTEESAKLFSNLLMKRIDSSSQPENESLFFLDLETSVSHYLKVIWAIEISRNDIKFITAKRNMEQFNSPSKLIKIVNESVITKYVNTGKHPFKRYNFKKINNLKQVVKIRRKTFKRLVDAKILLGPKTASKLY